MNSFQDPSQIQADNSNDIRWRIRKLFREKI